MVLHDQHVHTRQSHDSNETLATYLDQAEKLGLSYFVMTDHLDLNYLNAGDDWHPRFDFQVKENEELGKLHPNIKILLGVEIGYREEYLDELIEIKNAYPFDLINLSIHEFNGIDYYQKDIFMGDLYYPSLRKYFDLEVEGMERFPDFDILCHIDYGFKSAKKAHPEGKIQEFEEQIIKIFKKLIELDKVFEINTKVQETLDDEEHVRYLLNLYKSLGGKHIALSSDAHSTSRYLSSYEKYKNIIKECGFDHLCYFVKRVRYEFPI